MSFFGNHISFNWGSKCFLSLKSIVNDHLLMVICNEILHTSPFKKCLFTQILLNTGINPEGYDSPLGRHL